MPDCTHRRRDLAARTCTRLLSAALACLASGSAAAQAYANFEIAPVSPLALTTDGKRLLVANTADDRLEVFTVDRGGLTSTGHASAIPVGLGPVSVRARTSREAWVVNHLSDSISIVDLDAMRVVRTLQVGNEPGDVVFVDGTQGPRAFVSLGLPNQIAVYDLRNLDAPPQRLPVRGHRPRALATDGRLVYAAIFEAGNSTTLLPRERVSSAASPYPGSPNPPPNAGTGFSPAHAAGLPPAPPEGLIVRKDADGRWRDGNTGITTGGQPGADWTAAVNWDLHGNDVAVVDANTLAVRHLGGFLTSNMQLGVEPATGRLVVVGTDALNWLRFEPNLAGRFLRVMAAWAEPAAVQAGVASGKTDLNPHLDYASVRVPAVLRAQSLGDPRGIAFDPAGGRVFVAGMGSDSVAVLDARLQRIGSLDVGAGPAGVVFDGARNRLYVLNRFDASVSVVDGKSYREIQRKAYFDPTPEAIRRGRKFLYATRLTSGTGHVSCASCHVDARVDQLAWDLGDPAGAVKNFDALCNAGLGGAAGLCNHWHPMKGPMTTQTLVGLFGTEPLHWRGDRRTIADFNPTFVTLLGNERELSPQEMADFAAFLATLRFPPNPNRTLDDGLRTSLPVSTGTGNPVNGERVFRTVPTAGPLTCAICHVPPTGHNTSLISANLLQEAQDMKVPQLRNMYEKTGFDRRTQGGSDRGFGYAHDGASDTLGSFLSLPVFNFGAGSTGQQNRRDVEAFVLSFFTGTHAGTGAQITLRGPTPDAADAVRLAQFLAIADGGGLGLVARTQRGGLARGYFRSAGRWQSDRATESASHAELIAGTSPDQPLTLTLVPAGTEVRAGVDRDSDGRYDRDELDAGGDPAAR